MPITRRSLLKTALAGSALAAPLTLKAQAMPDAATEAKRSLGDNAKAMSTVSLPQSTEPAFAFRP